jgi:hypothetical protein
MLRRLRIAVSVFFAVLTVLLGVLWVRSYWYVDYFEHIRPSTVHARERRHTCRSYRGQLVIAAYELEMIRQNPLGFYYESRPIFPTVRERNWNEFPSSDILCEGPIWSLILVFATLGVAPWVPWPSRFRLRTLLIVVTLVAVVLAVWFAA